MHARNKTETEIVFLAGTEIKALADVLDTGRICAAADTADALLPVILSGLRAGDVVTVKASNSTGLGHIVAALTDPETYPRAANGD